MIADSVANSETLRSLDSDTSLMVSVRIFIRYLVGVVIASWLTVAFFDTNLAKVVLPLEDGGTSVRVS